jgi:hypothetical protein
VGRLIGEPGERRVVGPGFYVRVVFVVLLLVFTWWVLLWVRDYRTWVVSTNLLLAGGMLARRTFGVCMALVALVLLPEAGLAVVSMTR